MRKLLAARPAAPSPLPSGRRSPGRGLAYAPARLEWRVCTGPLTQHRPGQTRKGVAPLRWEEGRGRVGQSTCLEWKCPAQLWGDPARCCVFRGEAGRRVQDLRASSPP